MTRLELTLSAAPAGALDLSPLQPAALAALSLERIRRLKLHHGTRTASVGDLFAVNGEPGGAIALRGITPACFGIGRGMAGGRIEVSGHGGQELGREMSAGEIHLRGSAGDGLALGLRGGLVRVKGNAGARVGGAVPGAVHGMKGGTVIVDGDIGERGGERLRRGLIIVGGDCGPYLADRMVAGTIAVFGAAGNNVGLGMRRGTLLLAHPPEVLPTTFNPCGNFELMFVPVFARHVGEFDRNYARKLAAFATAQRWCGDMAHGGKGEILLPAS
ncbi:MAG: formylmethanofuran dehydrogenase subunit C [Gammaproteobacteria bacterium]|nr:formylmethanofuran dehydrogenase subunit C [Gammaproteobacteria bacterium]